MLPKKLTEYETRAEHKAQHHTIIGLAIRHTITANLLNALAKICSEDKIDADALETIYGLLDRNIRDHDYDIRYCFYNGNFDFYDMNDRDALKIFMEEYGISEDSRTIQQEDF